MATLRSNLSVFQPLSFCKTRAGLLIFANGIDRPGRYDGIDTVARLLGITAPTGPLGFTTSGGAGGSTAGAYIAAYRYTDDDKPTRTTSSLGDFTTYTAAGSIGFKYSGIAQPSADEVGRLKFVEIWRSTSGQSRTVYKVITLGLLGSMASAATADAGASVVFTTSTPHNLAVGAVITIAGTTDYNGALIAVTAVTTYTFKITDTFNGSQSGTWVLTGYGAGSTFDTYTDAALSAPLYEAMLVTNSKGTKSIARRQVVPPDFKPYVVMFQDRLWMGGVVNYTVGTVAVTAGSATVTGTGTAWPSTMVGRYIAITGDATLHLISAWVSATELTMAENATGSLSGVTYSITPSREERNQLYYSEQDEPESMSRLDVVPVQENTGDDDEITGLFNDGSLMYILKERHLYKLQYFEQPDIDAAVDLVARRGCVNHRCVDKFEGIMYLMDQAGIYSFTGGTVQPIGEPIQDLFRDGTISWTNSKWFHVKVDPTQQVVRFYVQYTGDSGTRPRRWLEYNVRNQTWVTGQTSQEIGSSCLSVISGQTRVLIGAEDDGITLINQGLADFGLGTTSGSATAASSEGDLRTSGSTFAATDVGRPLYFYAGTGKGMWGKISSYTSATQVGYTCLVGDDDIDSTTKFVIGAIHWRAKTGLFTFVESDQQIPRHVWITYQPTTDSYTPASVLVRMFKDHNTTAETNKMGSDRGPSIVQRTQDEADTVLLMSADPSTNTSVQPPGHELIEYHGRLDPMGRANRFMALEFRGYQSTEQPKIYRIEIVGVKEGR